MYKVESFKSYSIIKHTNSISDIAVCYSYSMRTCQNPLRYKEIRAKEMAKRIVGGLNLLDKIENLNLNSLTKKQLIELVTI